MNKTGKLLIRGGHIICPVSGLNGITDILIEGSRISRIGKIDRIPKGCMVFDAEGFTVFPGFIDMHVHLREPGREDEETIMSGCKAAAAGGFTAVCPMANTDPPTDDAGRVRNIIERSYGASARVYPYGSVTKKLQGEEIAELGDMAEAGAVGFSDDGNPLQTAALTECALRYSAMFSKSIVVHEEDLSLSADGQMHEGDVSTILGLNGIPSMAEELPIMRDLEILRWLGKTNAKLHITHVSTRRAVQLIRNAKKEGLRVTCDVTPHHLTLTDESLRTFNTNCKMKPPLRTKDDVEALMEGLKDTTIDAIATDHAPHSLEEKEVEFTEAAFGIIGLQTAVGLVLELIHNEIIDLPILAKTMSTSPATILGVDGGCIKEGGLADLSILDISMKWTLTQENILSLSTNTPFIGRTFTGGVRATVLGGQLITTT